MNMDKAVKLAAGGDDLPALMLGLGMRARVAARQVANSPGEQRNAALHAMASALRRNAAAILAANAHDVADASANGQNAAYLDRLSLDATRLEGIAAGVESIAALKDPVGKVLSNWRQPNGLMFERVATPLGVIAIIFESRPNVTADAGALCLKSGNAAILRAGSDSFRSSMAIAEAMQAGLSEVGLPRDIIQLVPTRDRAAVGAMLAGLNGNVAMSAPRMTG